MVDELRNARAATMPAVQLAAWQQPARVRRVPRPDPGPGEVLLEVRAAGLCHSDLHLMHWPAGTVAYDLPFTLGHEVAGVVAALGPGADGVEIGGRLPINTDGGCLANGEPIGASGLRQVHEVVLQLRGEAGDRQVPGSPRVGFTQVYGAPGVSACTVLSR